MNALLIRVGDVVTLDRACMNNPPGTRAVCYETYTLGSAPWARAEGLGDHGVSLLFSNGAHDGFSPHDLVIFGVKKIDHVPELASYEFSNVMQLTADYRAGRFAAAFMDREADG